MPACFIAGEEDAKYRREAQAMAASVPDGRAVLVPEAGHAVHLERPDEFARIVVEFLGAHQPAAARST